MIDHNRRYNTPAARELITRYRKLTEKQAATFGSSSAQPLEAAQAFFPVKCMRSLFNFGTPSCMLCVSASDLSGHNDKLRCDHCVHSFVMPIGGECDYLSCVEGCAEASYLAITHASSPQALVKAARDRADYLEHLLEIWSIACEMMTR